MFGDFKTRAQDFEVEKLFQTDRRRGPRRQDAERIEPRSYGALVEPTYDDRRTQGERRLDADWRFAVIRRSMHPG